MILKIKGWLHHILNIEEINENFLKCLHHNTSSLNIDRRNIQELERTCRELNKEIFILKGDIISLQAQIVKLTNAPFTPNIDKPTSPTISTKPLRVAKKKQDRKVPGRV